MALISFGVGSLVRHTAGAIAIVIALMFIIPLLENALPSNWHNDIMRFLPDAANQVVSAHHHRQRPPGTCGRPGRN